MKSAKLAIAIPFLIFACAMSGCNSSVLNDSAQGEKKKEETKVDDRADAIGKMSDQAQSPNGTK